MGFIDNLTGKEALEAMNRNIGEMEQVYAAFATRMIEILDKEERLDRSIAELKQILDGLSGTEKGKRLAATLERLGETSKIDEIRERLSVHETQTRRWLSDLETKLGQRIAQSASTIETVANNGYAMQSELSRVGKEIVAAAEERRGIGRDMVAVRARVNNVAKSVEKDISRFDQELSRAANERRRIGEDMVSVRARLNGAYSQIQTLGADQIDQNARIERLERGYKWLLGGLFAVLFVAIGLAAAGCGGM